MAVPRTQTDAPPVTRTGARRRARVRPLRASATRSLSAPSAVNAYTRVSRRRTRRPAASRAAVAPQTFGARVSRSSTRMRAVATRPTLVPG